MISRTNPELVWGHFLPMIEKGLAHGQGDSMAPCHVLEALKSGHMDMLVSHEGEELKGAAIIEITRFPTKLVLFVVLLIGERLSDWVDEMEQALIDYRDAIGADCIEASCRDGLVRVLNKRGWKRKATILTI